MYIYNQQLFVNGIRRTTTLISTQSMILSGLSKRTTYNIKVSNWYKIYNACYIYATAVKTNVILF